ncbi:MAG: hypothetical protein Kow0019_13700 [Methanobacteriaceae archaeon]
MITWIVFQFKHHKCRRKLFTEEDKVLIKYYATLEEIVEKNYQTLSDKNYSGPGST